MSNFILKTKFKLKLLFTDPIQLIAILKNMFKTALVSKIDTGPEGSRWTTEIEKDLLQKYARHAKVGIVEIGILDGKTTKELALVANVPIYGIDPLIPDSMNKKLMGTEEKIRKNLEFYPNFNFVKDFSFNVSGNWTAPFDFIFIDGDHTYKAVQQDFEEWFPLLSKNGYVAFHDSAPISVDGKVIFDGWPGCVQLIRELKKDSRLKYIETQDSITVFQK
ncbi:MAG TPA: class I SAM-dependent methyltransferase [Candidatus Paceibacterota bacterium]|nr:class I SAM-dependent methyltransferase [Candidatus Paceibacterota bacterium]HMO82750.1 class I SAM-dependent methyltransferase [Candidatus Paceibacterota bacterium]